MSRTPRGYFGIGVERLSKPMNLGSLLRTAHAFGASFVFTIDVGFEADAVQRSDTADTPSQVPLYTCADVDSLMLPHGCALVGVELRDDAVALPSFRHPHRVAYVLGPERDSLSPALLERCDFVVKIPTRFCINVGLAGALVMYDRMISLGRFAERPLIPGGPVPAPAPHRYGAPVLRRRRAATASVQPAPSRRA
jgi:tRNA G18 (ribose-2'-O)-methylase SpoU